MKRRPSPGAVAAVRGWMATAGAAVVMVVALGCAKRLVGTEGAVGSQETLIYVAGKVRTLDPARPIAEALAVRGGKVLAVGGREELSKKLGRARVLELPGATVVPGLADAHAHLSALGRALTQLDVTGTASAGEVVAKARQAGRESYQGDWLVGGGWDQNDWPQGQRAFPHRAQLDTDFPATPVFLTRIDGHAVWVNGEALRRSGISRETADPPGGRIMREASGEPTGVLVDNAIDLVERMLPPLTDEQREVRLRVALLHCVKVGLTSVHDAGMDLATFALLQQWDAAGALPLRVYAMAQGQGPEAEVYLERGTFAGRFLTLRAVKFLLDGALGSRGAALHQPYSDEPSQSGLLLLEPEALAEQAHRFMERGFQVAVHAIGDRANTLALDVLVQAAARARAEMGRHRVEHAQVLRREDIPRFAQHGIIASMQPTHATSDMPWAEARVGKERVQGGYAWKSLLDAGAKLAFGSDFPVEDANPLLGLYAARTRQDARGSPAGGWLPTERLDAEQALRGFTMGAAYAAFAEAERGVLAPERDADFVALSVDPVEAPPQALLSGRALLTVVGGQEVYRAP